MAKKNTTLQDLSKFLHQGTPKETEKKVQSVEDFISKEPVRLAKVNTTKSEVSSQKPARKPALTKANSTVAENKVITDIKPTIPAIKVAIESYAQEHHLTEQEVYYKLNPLVNEKVTTFHPLESFFKLQQHYVELWLQMNRTFWKL